MRTASKPSDFDDLVFELDRAMDQLIQRRFCQFRASDKWSPAINAYRLPDRVEVCVDLAGVERDTIDLSVQTGALVLRGLRRTPAPELEEGFSHSSDAQILVMEIEHGPFERVLRLPRDVNVDRVDAEQVNGMLFIRLPLRSPRQIDL